VRQVGGGVPKLGRVFRFFVVACFIACEPGEPVDPGFQPRDTPCISTCLPQRRSGAVLSPKLLQDQYANYVVQTALTVSKPPQLTHLRPAPGGPPSHPRQFNPRVVLFFIFILCTCAIPLLASGNHGRDNQG